MNRQQNDEVVNISYRVDVDGLSRLWLPLVVTLKIDIVGNDDVVVVVVNTYTYIFLRSIPSVNTSLMMSALVIL